MAGEVNTGSREVEALAARKASPPERARQALALLTQRRLLRAYKRCFLDDNGNLTADGARVLGDLARATGLGKVRLGASGEELNAREGKRGLLLHIFARFDRANLERLARRMRESQDHE